MAGSVVNAPTGQRSGWQWLDRLLIVLRSWQLLAGCSAMMLLLLAASLLLPQIPGQISEDPVATARWLQEWNPATGQLSAWQRALGLYTVLSSPLFQLIAAFTFMLTILHLANGVALILALRRLPQALHAPDSVPPQGAPIFYPQQILRQRAVTPQPPVIVAEAVERTLAALPGRLLREIRNGENQAISDATGRDAAEALETDNVAGEQRWLLVRHERSAWLRPWLFGGLALALVSLWLAVHVGWSVTPAPLAPGESYSYAPHGLLLEYGIHPRTKGATASAILTATVVSDTITLDVETNQSGNAGGAQIRMTKGTPALWVQAPAALLLAPGDLPEDARPGLGLLFPQPGSEQVVVLANRNAGLRIVRLADADTDRPAFLVEVYEAGSAQPSQRLQVSDAAGVVMGQKDAPLELGLTPTVGIQVEASRRPGLWLLWLALGMAVVGAWGYLRRPGFTLVQLAHWPVERSVMVVQSDTRAEIPGIS